MESLISVSGSSLLDLGISCCEERVDLVELNPLQEQREMSFRSIVQDLRDGIGSLSRRSFDFRLSGLHKGKSQGSSFREYSSSRDLLSPVIVQTSRWANLPPELLFDVIRRLEESESNWPARKHVVACASVCRSWREMCQEIVVCPEICGKLTFPVSLKQVRLYGFVNSMLLASSY